MEHDFSLLLVEPEETHRKLIEDVLCTEFEVANIATSTSSADTMSLLSVQSGVQCIIISTELDDSSGIDLIKNIRNIEKYAKTPILVISSAQEKDHLLKAAASGASDFIVKPFNSRSLTLKLKKLLAHKKLRKTSRVSTLGSFDVSVCFEEATYVCKLIDISLGGCSIKSLPFRQGGTIFDQLTVNIDNNGSPLIISSELVRAERDPECEDMEEKSQIASFQFIDPNEEMTDAITAFIDGIGS